MIHNREADEETAAALAPFGGTVVLHCFSSPGLVSVAVERGYYVSFAGNATYPSAAHLREAVGSVPVDRILVETDSPYLAPQPVRGRPNEPANVVHTVRALAEARGEGSAELAARTHANAAAAFGLRVTVEPEEGARPALPRRREHPRRHRANERPRRVRRRRRGRPRARSAHALSCRRVSVVHAIELDRSLEPALRERWTGVTNVRLRAGTTRSTSTIAALRPQPNKLVANLPYNVATPLVVETLEHAPSLEQWCVMVQREVADRFFAEPRTKAYGAVSVLVQLSARKTGFHPVAPTVFRPPPRVESALVAFERQPIAAIADVRAVVEAAFAHRRKTAANALAQTGSRRETRRGSARGARAAAERACGGARAQEFVGSRRRCDERCGGLREDQPRARRRGVREDGKHEVVTVLQRIDLHDTITVDPADELVVDGFAEDTIVRGRSRHSRRRPEASRAGASTSRSGSRSPQVSAAGAAMPRRRSRSRTRRWRSRSTARASRSPRASARTSRSSCSRGRSWHGRRDGARGARPADRVRGRSRRSARRERRTRRGAVYAEFDARRGRGRVRRSRRRARRGARLGAHAHATSPRSLPTTSPRLRSRASSRTPERSAPTSRARGRPSTGCSRTTTAAVQAAASLSSAGRTFVTRPAEAGDLRVSGKMAPLLGRGQVVRQRVLVP